MSVARHPLKMVCLPDSTTSAEFFHHRDTENTEKKGWKIGMMEEWNIGKTNCLSTIPLFHYSIFLNSACSEAGFFV
jgi:hypothetical protein